MIKKTRRNKISGPPLVTLPVISRSTQTFSQNAIDDSMNRGTYISEGLISTRELGTAAGSDTTKILIRIKQSIYF
jgi:hypothetical protein